MGFSRQGYWSGLPCPPPGDLPNPGIEPRSPALQVDSLLSEPPRKPSGNLNDYVLVSDSSDSKESACNAGDLGSIPGAGRVPGEGNGCPLQYSCLENSMAEEPSRLQSVDCKESDTNEQLILSLVTCLITRFRSNS